MNRFWLALLPELRRFPSGEQGSALRDARGTELDVLELLAMAAGLVLVTALTRYGLSDLSIASRLGSVLLNFLVAAPLLLLVLGPFHVRRMRRGLRERLRRQDQP